MIIRLWGWSFLNNNTFKFWVVKCSCQKLFLISLLLCIVQGPVLPPCSVLENVIYSFLLQHICGNLLNSNYRQSYTGTCELYVLEILFICRMQCNLCNWILCNIKLTYYYLMTRVVLWNNSKSSIFNIFLHRTQRGKMIFFVCNHFKPFSSFAFPLKKNLNLIETWRKLGLHLYDRPERFVPEGCSSSCRGLVRARWGHHQLSSYQNGMSAGEVWG
jgi:hypothetical protein